MLEKIIQKTYRVPVIAGREGPGGAFARQLDIALMSVGFKLSGDLLQHLSMLHPDVVDTTASVVLSAVRQQIGDHARHNVYFKDFPEGVPDTVEFWMQCIVDALSDPGRSTEIWLQLLDGWVNLLDLPKYGRYQHSYEEMIAAHEQFIPSVKDRVTVLHLGKSMEEETLALYYSFASSPVPLNEEDRSLLAALAEACLRSPQPDSVPVRENKAIINRVRLMHGLQLLVDTVTDILRLACALSSGDETLRESTRFRSFPRNVRRAMMMALNDVISKSSAKLADVNRYHEVWKRLGERLHPHEYPFLDGAQQVFAVARGERRVPSLAGELEKVIAAGNIVRAISLLASNPGMLIRGVDRIARLASGPEADILLEGVKEAILKVSGRVILSLREHLQNRETHSLARVFVNSKGKAWVTKDTRIPLSKDSINSFIAVFDAEIVRRLPRNLNILADPAIREVALPLSQKNTAGGFGILPCGSTHPVTAGILRFFVYWKQKEECTDYDLSALLLDENYRTVGQLSWTNLRHGDSGMHSGDIVEAREGASEFIDIDLRRVNATVVVPQVNIYTGESFTKVEECFFGFMELAPGQRGEPFEARTVRMKSDMRGKGKVALPLAFIRNSKGKWAARWLHLYLNGQPNFNRVERNRISTALVVQSIVNRQYLSFMHLFALMANTNTLSWYEGQKIKKPVTFIGLEPPEGLPSGSKVYALSNLRELIPA